MPYYREGNEIYLILDLVLPLKIKEIICNTFYFLVPCKLADMKLTRKRPYDFMNTSILLRSCKHNQTLLKF